MSSDTAWNSPASLGACSDTPGGPALDEERSQPCRHCGAVVSRYERFCVCGYDRSESADSELGPVLETGSRSYGIFVGLVFGLLGVFFTLLLSRSPLTRGGAFVGWVIRLVATVAIVLLTLALR